MLNQVRVLKTLCAVGAYALLACGTEGGLESNADVPVRGESAALMVAADTGGEMVLKDMALKVPAGALDNDTEISVAVEDAIDVPDKSSVVGPVYRFGPAGTQFKRAVTMELPLARLPGGKEKAHVAWLDEETHEWVKLSDSRRDGDKLVASVMHFTRFTVTFEVVEDGTVAQTGGICAADDFSPCGGNIEGTWAFTAACFNGVPFDQGPAGECSGAKTEISIDISGTVTFAGGQLTGTQTMSVDTMVSLPKSCLPEGADCASFQATDAGDTCDIVDSSGEQSDTIEETYEVDGTRVFFTDGSEAEYCVQGSTLTVLVYDGLDGSEVRYTATRR